MNSEDYLRRVAFELRDLPWAMRRDLVSELRHHLSELPDAANLGAPEQYAADLRAAAGLERRRGAIAFLRARRLRNVVATVIALAVIGLAIGSVVWIESYQPITFDGGGIEPQRAKSEPGVAAVFVIFKKGRPFRFGVTVKNTGPFAVRVLGVSYPSTLPFSAHLVATRILQGSGAYAIAPLPVPFTLKPGNVAALTLEGVYRCGGMSNSTTIGLTDFPIRYSFLWRTATARVRLVEPLGIHLQGDAGCPPLTKQP